MNERVSRNEREATLEKQKIELAKLQLAQLEKDIELQTAKNKALSLNPAAKVEEKQFETNIENMIKSIKTLSLPVPTRSENFNLFFQSLERAFLTKKINEEYKSEILINLLGERAHNVLLYIKKEELNDYEKLKSIVLREFQHSPSLSVRTAISPTLTGVKMRTKQDLEILKLLEEEIMETFTENREKIREEAKRNILKMQEENCRNFNKKRKKGIPSLSVPSFLYVSDSPLVSKKKKGISTAADSGQSGWPLWNRQLLESLAKHAVFARRRS
ncbi:uncharacterized protein TNCV_3454671 [Trichonephila clavipes]|nr:uncharacterized protein TNCV_3454671 [Trichonephila clavipes]